MVFTTGQLLGIGLFTAIVLVIGVLLLKLDSMVGTNYDTPESEPTVGAEASSAAPVQAHNSARARRRKRRH